MSLNTQVGTFVLNSVTGNQSITGLGFTPKIILLFYNNETGNTINPSIQGGHGVALSSSDRRCVGFSQPNNNVPTGGANTLAGHYNDRCIRYCRLNGDTASVREADFVSMDADGFTINILTTDGTQSWISYLAIGGTDLTNVKTGQFVQNTGTGDQAITGVGFQPDCLLFIRGRFTTSAPSSTANSNLRPAWGFAKSASSRGVSITNASGGASSFASKVYQRTTKFISAIKNDSSAIDSEADLKTMDSDGFTITWSTAATAGYVFYVAFKGCNFAISSFNQNTSNGNQSISGFGFQPNAVILVSDNQTTSSSIQANLRQSIGFATDSTHRACAWYGQTDGSALSVNDESLDTANVLEMITEGVIPTTNTVADFVSNDSDGITINNTTTDGTAREILLLAFGQIGGATPIKTLPLLGAGL